MPALLDALSLRLHAVRWRVLMTCALLLATGCGWLTHWLTFDAMLRELRGNAHHRLDLYANSLEREIDKYAHLPYVASLDRTVTELLAAADDARLRQQTNVYLEQLNERAGTLAIYILSPTGKVIASSNWNLPDSFVDRNLSYRPYFQNARTDRVERFYGIGTTNNQPGYYLSVALERNGQRSGIAVVKVSLEQLEKSWLSAESPAILYDEHGVVVLASVPDWRYATLKPLDATTRRLIDQTQQYNRHELPPLGLQIQRELDKNTHIVVLPPRPVQGINVFPTAGLFLAQTRVMAGTPWRLTVFSDLRKARDLAWTRAALAAAGTAFALVFLFMLAERQRVIRERLAAQAALQEAYAGLERKVAERTQELKTTNEQLGREVVERTDAERTLRAAQEELVQAGKLAVIGQLSAGIAHELNQPLAALSTLSSNAVRFLERGDQDTARFNLQRIEDLVRRMGVLTGQLRSFSRKSSGELAAVPVVQAVDNAVTLLEQRLARNGVVIERLAPAEVIEAHCDAVRLEQVLVNLIRNAMDATTGQSAPPRVVVSWVRENDQVCLKVQDNGSGLSEEARGRLFEPFFTTKKSGGGLGLGLAISADIVRGFGGTLTADNTPEGGAVFTLRLAVASNNAGRKSYDG
jgi:two-component system C4-dicarboxylate transport sensor histidine kinase DctB